MRENGTAKGAFQFPRGLTVQRERLQSVDSRP